MVFGRDWLLENVEKFIRLEISCSDGHRDIILEEYQTEKNTASGQKLLRIATSYAHKSD